MKNLLRPLLFVVFAFFIVFLMETRIKEMEKYQAQLQTINDASIIYVDIGIDSLENVEGEEVLTENVINLETE